MLKSRFTRTSVLLGICFLFLFLSAVITSAQDVGEESGAGLLGGAPADTQKGTTPPKDTITEAEAACAICDPGCIQSSRWLCVDEVKETGVYVGQGAPSVTVEVCATDSEVLNFSLSSEGPFSDSINVIIPAGGSQKYYVKGLKAGSATEVVNWPSGWFCITSPARVPCCCLPWTVAEPVEFQGATDCGRTDSGFDNTTATTNAPWLSVAKGGSTKVASAVIPPSTNPKDVTFSPEAGTTGQITVSPTKPKKSTQILTVKGVTPGDTAIQAKTGNANCSKLNVAVYEGRMVKVAAHVITAQGCSAPNPKTSKGKLQSGLNAIWDQALIEFNVTIDKKTVAYDLNDNCILDQITLEGEVDLGPEIAEILKEARDPNADVNVFYVKDLQPGQAGFAALPSRDCFIEQIDFGNIDNFTAHEIGHTLNLLDSSDTTNLMLDVRTAMNPTPCFLNKVQWDKSNQAAGTLMQALTSFVEVPSNVSIGQEPDRAGIENLFLDLRDGEFDHDSLELFLSMRDKTIPILLSQLGNKRPIIRETALDLLGRIDFQDDGVLNQEEVVYAMQSTIDGWEASQVEVDTALRYLERIDPWMATPQMIEALFFQLENGAPRAALVLGRLGDPSLRQGLLPYLDSADKAVVELTKVALAKLGDQWYLAEILSQLDAEDVDLRSAGFQKLAYIGDTAAVPRIAEFLWDFSPLQSRTPDMVYTPYRFLAAAALAVLVDNPPVRAEIPELYTDEGIALWSSWWQTNQSQYR